MFQLLIGLIQSRDNRVRHVLSSETTEVEGYELMALVHTLVLSQKNCDAFQTRCRWKITIFHIHVHNNALEKNGF